MSLRNSNLVENEYFHIYNRGNGKMEIFRDKEDYDRFMKLLYICNSEKSFSFRDNIVEQQIDCWDFKRDEPLVDICSWVLMPNHFHIVLISHRSDLWEKGYSPITEFMRKLSTAYVMYFNRKYSRTGSLFEGKFKSRHVGKDNYFNYLFSYIHLNPVKILQSDWKEKGIKDKEKALNFIKTFPYSSFIEFFGEKTRSEAKILNTDSLPEDFKVRNVNDLFEWLNNFPEVGPMGKTQN